MALYQVFVNDNLTAHSFISINDAKRKAAQHIDIKKKYPLRIESLAKPAASIRIWAYDYDEGIWVEQEGVLFNDSKG